MNEVLKQFPNIKLSYDKQLHNKVSCDIYSITPKGCKAVLWFTYKDETPIVYIFHYRYNNIIKSETPIVSFDSTLCLGKGTILQGVLFHIKSLSHFSISDILYYKGKLVKYNFKDSIQMKLQILSSYIKQERYTKKSLVIGLPYISKKYDDIIKKMNELEYNIQGFVCHDYQRYHSQGIVVFKDKIMNSNDCIMKIKSTYLDDVYHIYIDDEYYNVCCVPTYKSSKLLNELFNKNKMDTIDSIEESDNEEDFEDKNSFSEVIKKMKCKYHQKFKKWEPYENIEDDSIEFSNLELIKKQESI